MIGFPKNHSVKISAFFWIAAGIILLAGIFFRFWNLGTDELTFDEGSYAFRSIGYLDYMENPAQTTPIQQFPDRKMPRWLLLSFHDAPPLFFAIEHAFFGLLGESLLVSRLPSAFAGLGSIVLIFFVTRLLFSKFKNEKLQEWKDCAGLLSAAVMAISFSAVAISRLNQLESVLFFLLLLNIYFFLLFIDDAEWWWAFGASFGLCMLTKYVSVFLIPTYFIYLLIIRSSLLKNWKWYAGWGIAGVIFLPVIVYNWKLYELTGHFDLQFAYLFHQPTPEWLGFGGKNQEPFGNIIQNLRLIYSVPFILLTLAGISFAAWQKNLGKIRWLFIIALILILALLTATGSAIRFISLLIIPGVIFIALAIITAKQYLKKTAAAAALVLLFLSYESYFTANLLFFNKADYGIVKLDKYLDKTFGNARPAGILKHPNQNLNEVIKKYAENRPATLQPVGIVYDDEISTPARLWLFSRRQYYQGIPVMPASEFLKVLQSSGEETFKGFQIYLVKAGSATTISPVSDAAYHRSFDAFWAKLHVETKFTVTSGGGAAAFEVSTFSF